MATVAQDLIATEKSHSVPFSRQLVPEYPLITMSGASTPQQQRADPAPEGSGIPENITVFGIQEGNGTPENITVFGDHHGSGAGLPSTADPASAQEVPVPHRGGELDAPQADARSKMATFAYDDNITQLEIAITKVKEEIQGIKDSMTSSSSSSTSGISLDTIATMIKAAVKQETQKLTQDFEAKIKQMSERKAEENKDEGYEDPLQHHDPWLNSGTASVPSGIVAGCPGTNMPQTPPGIPTGPSPPGVVSSRNARECVPLFRAPLTKYELGTLRLDKPLDDKVAQSDNFKFNGKTGGLTWKDRAARYMIGKIPALKAVLEWAEKVELHGQNSIREEEIMYMVGIGMGQDEVRIMNGAVWTFISLCVSDEAENVFRGAEALHGLDAWRRLARQIDHGRATRKELLRREVKDLYQKHIRSLDQVESAVAMFDNKIREYVEAGGTAPDQYEQKSDMHNILPGNLKEHLLNKVTDESVSYVEFRDAVVSQAKAHPHPGPGWDPQPTG